MRAVPRPSSVGGCFAAEDRRGGRRQARKGEREATPLALHERAAAATAAAAAIEAARMRVSERASAVARRQENRRETTREREREREVRLRWDRQGKVRP